MPLTSWPTVLTEAETIAKVAAGYSLARFGNAELYVMQGDGCMLEPQNPLLAAELRQILSTPPPHCLPCIPTMLPTGPKYTGWTRRIEGFLPLLSARQPYGSAFISRPESAPWIDTLSYVQTVCDLWRYKRVALVCTDTNAIGAAISATAKKYYYIPCPPREAYEHVDALEAAAINRRADMVVLSCGPTATCLAARLTRQGVQALDVGSMGSLLMRHLRQLGPERYHSTLWHPEATDAETLRQLLTAAGFTAYGISALS